MKCEDATGIKIGLGDWVEFPRERLDVRLPGQPSPMGVVVRVSEGTCTINVPYQSLLGGATLVYNIPCNECMQIYSASSIKS